MPAAAAYRAAPGSPYLPPGFEAHPQQPKCSQSLEATAPAGSVLPPAGSTYANANPAPAAFAPAAAPPSLPLHPSHAQPQPPHQAALRPPAAPAPHGVHTHSSSTQTQTGVPLAAAPLATPGVSVATPSTSKEPSPKAAPTAKVWLFPLADAGRARSRSRSASRACPKWAFPGLCGVVARFRVFTLCPRPTRCRGAPTRARSSRMISRLDLMH